jgi:omega-6 fatty acid desaturase (delta-12 desaturase)
LKALKPFRFADDVRGMMELAITVAPLVFLWVATMLLVRAGYWAGLLLAIPAGAFLLRLFIIQHDCGHGSFFRKRAANTWVGRAIGVFTLTPYEFWRRSHAHHHARTGNLDHRGLGDVDTLTLTEYRALTPLARWRYRVYRHPIVLFGLGPAIQFLVRHRLPFGITTGGLRPWMSVATTNAAILVFCVAVAWYFGLAAFLMVHLPITLIAATLGVWLFYIQHQFEHTVWEEGADWSFPEAALYGSSYYELPPVLRWFSANIGVHHVHHLCSTIPSYRMQSVLRAFPELKSVSRLGFKQSLGATRLALWDENARRLISFKEERAA